jgi:hypothetical protein
LLCVSAEGDGTQRIGTALLLRAARRTGEHGGGVALACVRFDEGDDVRGLGVGPALEEIR